MMVNGFLWFLSCIIKEPDMVFMRGDLDVLV